MQRVLIFQHSYWNIPPLEVLFLTFACVKIDDLRQTTDKGKLRSSLQLIVLNFIAFSNYAIKIQYNATRVLFTNSPESYSTVNVRK